MRFFLALFFVSVSFQSLASTTDWLSIVSNNCHKPQVDEPPIYRDDFSVKGWFMDLPTMKSKYDNLYHSPKRLAGRAYFDPNTQTLVMPYENIKKTQHLVKLTPLFIKSITQHIEKSLKREYVDYVFFPDMGHSHMLIPQKLYDEKYDALSDDVPNMHLFYQGVFAEPSLKFLYHTAEQLRTNDKVTKKPINSRKLLFRYMTRNLVGYNNGSNSLDIHYSKEDAQHNTVHGEKGFRWWSGFNLSANHNGCFPFKQNGKTYYFDITLKEYEADPKASQASADDIGI